jgi:hypothetical protein
VDYKVLSSIPWFERVYNIFVGEYNELKGVSKGIRICRGEYKEWYWETQRNRAERSD